MTLSDPYPPSLKSLPSGALFDGDSPVEGHLAALFTAEDRGGGIATVAVVVDGVIVGEQGADPNALDCPTPYVAPVPCPLTTSGSIEFDTTRSPTAHIRSHSRSPMREEIERLSAPVTVAVRNPGAANGAHASRFARLDAWFETRSKRDAGRLRPRVMAGLERSSAGWPTRTACRSVMPYWTSRRSLRAQDRRPAHSVRSRRTRRASSATCRGSGSSRRLTVGYRAFHLDDASSATATSSTSAFVPGSRSMSLLGACPRVAESSSTDAFAPARAARARRS